MVRAWCSGAVVLAILATTALAEAEPAARFVYLRGKDTESCPSEAEVRVAVQTRLGYDPFSSYAASTMFAEVSASNGGYVASLKLVDGDNTIKGDRTLKVQGRCAELVDAMALTISIAIDPMSVTRNGPPPDAPPSEKAVAAPTTDATPTPPATEPAPPPEPAEHPAVVARSRDVALFVGAGPIASVGAAPAVAVGGVLSVEAQLGHLVGSVEGRADLPSSAAAGDLGRVKSSLVAGFLFLGGHEGPFSAGVVGGLGRIAVTSEDDASHNDQSALYLGAGFRVGVGLPLGERFELRARAEVLGNLERHTLTISGQDAYRFPVASADIAIALAVRLP